MFFVLKLQNQKYFKKFQTSLELIGSTLLIWLSLGILEVFFNKILTKIITKHTKNFCLKLMFIWLENFHLN